MPVTVRGRPADDLADDLIERWRAVPVAVAVDVSGGACQVDPAIRPLMPPGRQPRLFGRALTALGEREGARDKLEEGASRLRLAMDALRSTDSLQQAEVALRALQRAEQTLQQRRRVGLRWPG